MSHPNSFGSRATLTVGDRQYAYFRLDTLDALPGSTAKSLPFSLRVLLENLLRGEDNAFVKKADVEALVGCVAGAVLVDETRAMAAAAGLREITLTSKPEYIDAMTNWEDPLYRKIIESLPAGSKTSDYITSLDVSARKSR